VPDYASKYHTAKGVKGQSKCNQAGNKSEKIAEGMKERLQ